MGRCGKWKVRDGEGEGEGWGKVIGKLREVEGEASKRRNNETRSGGGCGKKDAEK